MRRWALSPEEHDHLRRELEVLNRDFGENLGFHDIQAMAEQIVNERRRR